MKIANIVTNVVLAIAVVVLFILHFSGGSAAEAGEAQTADIAAVAPGELGIAYFNMDSVLTSWDLYMEFQQDLQKKQTEMDAELSGKTETLYQGAQDLQYKVQRGLVTRSEAEQLQQNLAAEEQNLMALQNQYSMQLQEEGLVSQRKALDMIETYIKEISESAGYSYVYSYTFGGNLIYGNKAHDITSQVIAGLNEKYTPGTEAE